MSENFVSEMYRNHHNDKYHISTITMSEYNACFLKTKFYFKKFFKTPFCHIFSPILDFDIVILSGYDNRHMPANHRIVQIGAVTTAKNLPIAAVCFYNLLIHSYLLANKNTTARQVVFDRTILWVEFFFKFFF